MFPASDDPASILWRGSGKPGNRGNDSRPSGWQSVLAINGMSLSRSRSKWQLLAYQALVGRAGQRESTFIDHRREIGIVAHTNRTDTHYYGWLPGAALGHRTLVRTQ